MQANFFVTTSRVAPLRWREAFPDAVTTYTVPSKLPADALVWLHNLAPADYKDVLPKGAKIIVLHDEPGEENGLAALSSGAVGYVNSHATPQVLHTVEAVVRSGGLWVGEELLSRLLRTYSTVPAVVAPQPDPALAKLSEREREVALKVSRGESNKEIARELNVAERTVKAHLSAIFEKLNVRDRLQLAILLKAEQTT